MIRSTEMMVIDMTLFLLQYTVHDARWSRSIVDSCTHHWATITTHQHSMEATVSSDKTWKLMRQIKQDDCRVRHAFWTPCRLRSFHTMMNRTNRHPPVPSVWTHIMYCSHALRVDLERQASRLLETFHSPMKGPHLHNKPCRSLYRVTCVPLTRINRALVAFYASQPRDWWR